MIEMALPLALTILEEWKNLNVCFLPGSLYHGLYLKPRVPNCLLLLMATENDLDIFAPHSKYHRKQTIRKSKLFLRIRGGWG